MKKIIIVIVVILIVIIINCSNDYSDKSLHQNKNCDIYEDFDKLIDFVENPDSPELLGSKDNIQILLLKLILLFLTIQQFRKKWV